MQQSFKLISWLLIVISMVVIAIALTTKYMSGNYSSTPDYQTEITINSEAEFTGQSLEPVSADSISAMANALQNIGPISSILISQKGELIAEAYFGRMNIRGVQNIKSASKSILSILVGIAIDRGYLEGVHQPIGEFFPNYFDANPDSLKESITIGDLLTMRSGLASTSRQNYGQWVISRNWVKYVLDQPVTGKRGVDRNYSTGNTHLLSVILTRATGMSARAFADQYLFEPMDIQVGGWDRDPQGFYFGGNNMALRPRDMVKIGELMMNMGKYNGREIISEEWIVESVEPVTGRRPGVINYGYLWFRRMSAGFHMVYAFGNGGQYIMILPELEAVITVTTWNNASGTRSYRRELFRKLDNEIVPALKTRTDVI